MTFPYKFISTPFATSGDLQAVPDGVQSDGSVSYAQGYGADYSLDPTTNPSALLVERKKTNQLWQNQTASEMFWQQNSFPQFIDSTTNGGSAFSYGLGVAVMYDPGGGLRPYVSLKAANTDLPTVIASWVPLVTALTNRQKLLTATSYYITTTGNDTTGDGSSGNPWATLQKAFNFCRDSLDLNSQAVTINVANGSYVGLSCNGSFVGGTAVNVTFVGASQSGVTISGSGGVACISGGGGSFSGCGVQNMTLSISNAPAISIGIYTLFFVRNIAIVGSTTGAIINAQDGAYLTLGGSSSTCSASGANLFVSSSSAEIVLDSSLVLAMAGTPTYTVTAATGLHGRIYNAGASITGSANGQKYSCIGYGVIQSNGAGVNFFPGSTAGAVNNGLYL